MINYLVLKLFSGNGLFESEKELGRKYLANLSPLFLVTATKLANRDASTFSETMLREDITKAMHPIDWWKSADPDKLPLGFQDFVIKLFVLPSSTGSLERNFSTLGNILTKKRNRLGIGKASKLCVVHQILQVDTKTRDKIRGKRKWFDYIDAEEDYDQETPT